MPPSKNSKLQKLLVSVCAILLTGTLAACTPLTLFSGKKIRPATISFCDAGEPIYWSPKDTAKTVAQIKEHNAVGVDLNCKKWKR